MKAVCLLNCSPQGPALCVNAANTNADLIFTNCKQQQQQHMLHAFSISHPGLQWTSDRVKSRQVRPNSAKKVSLDEISMGRHRQRFLRKNENYERKQGHLVTCVCSVICPKGIAAYIYHIYAPSYHNCCNRLFVA